MKKNVIILALFLMLFSSASALSAVSSSNVNSPVNILSEYTGSFSPGEKVPVKFDYRFSCPLAYSIDIYEDNDLSNSVCTRIVQGMGWITTNTYSGIVCQKTSGYSNVIEDVCGISSDAKDGSYTVYVVLFDFHNKPTVFNTKVGAIQISSNKPDLTASIEFPHETFAGDLIPVNVLVNNSGLRDASSFSVSLYVISSSVKTLIEKKLVKNLKQGASQDLLFDFDSSLFFPGEYYFEAVVDSEFSVDEQNENNNLVQETVLLSASSDYPDLVIASLDVADSINKGELILISAKIKNNGLTNFSDNFIVSLIDSSGNILESKVVYGLDSDREKTILFSVSSSGYNGETKFVVFIDKFNLISEISKTNNFASVSLNVVSDNPVLTEKCFNDVDDDKDGVIDEGCKADYAVKLKDYVISSSDKKFFPVFDSDSGLNKFRFDSSQVPYFFVVPFEVNVKLGENKDYFNEFNGKELCINVSDKKRNDLTLVFSGKTNDSFSGKDYSFLEFINSFGGFFSYLWIVDGEQKSLPDSYLSSLYSWTFFSEENSGFYFNPELLGFDSGEYEISISSDCYRKEPDGNPLNDSDSIIVKIVSKEEDNGIDDDDDGIIDNGFDLFLEDFSFDSEVLMDEPSTKAYLTVKNNGNFVSPQVKVYFFNNEVNEKNIIFSDKIGSLNAEEEKVFSFSIPSRNFSDVENEIIAFIDYDNSFAESNEINNKKSLTLFKYRDLVSLKISEANFDREIVSLGSTVKLTAKIKNNGFVDSQDFFVVVMDSLTDKIVDRIKVSGLKAGISLQNLQAENSKQGLFFANKIDFVDLSNATVEYDYLITGDLIGNRNYDVCISYDEEDNLVTNENDCKKIFLVASEKADLRVNLFKPFNEDISLGKSVLIELEMENKGVKKAENFSVELYYYTAENEKKTLNFISGFSLESNETYKLVFSVDFSKEINGSIFAELDSLSEIDEDDETNNIFSLNLYSYLIEQCDNDLDDDLDGLTDEGCTDNKFVVVNKDSIKNQFVLDVMQKEMVVGKLQKIVFYHSVSGPLVNEKITVVSPSKKIYSFSTASDGSVNFLVDELGSYTVTALVKSVVFDSSFKVISEEQASYSVVYLLADFVFGSPDSTNPFLIPVILLLSFIVASFAFLKVKSHCVELADFFVLKTNYCAVFSALVAFILFLIILASNRLFGLIGFAVVLIIEFVLVYYFDSYYSGKQEKRKSDKSKKEKQLIKSNNETERKEKKKKPKFILRI